MKRRTGRCIKLKSLRCDRLKKYQGFSSVYSKGKDKIRILNDSPHPRSSRPKAFPQENRVRQNAS